MRCAVVVGLVAVAACRSTPPPSSAANESPASKAAAAAPAATSVPQRGGAPHAGYFVVPADQLGHVKVALVEEATWSTVVHTTGTVDWDQDRTTQTITQVSGPVSRIVVDTGTRVKKGDPLLYVASADVANAISTYRKAKNRFDLTQRELARSKDLFAHKALSQADLDSAEAEFNDASTDLQTSQQTLRVFGVTQQEIAEAEQQNVPIRPELVLRAPISGTVVQKMVNPGQVIQSGTTAVFVISDTSTVWVQGHVYDRDLGSVHIGDKVDERNTAIPEQFHGVVSYIGDVIDPATRTTPVRIVTPNRDGMLKKDLFLDLVIHDKSTRKVTVVPTAAVLYDEDNFPFVYVQESQGQFAERQVKIGSQQDDQTEIVSGLKPGEPIVTQGSVFLQFANTYQQ